MATAQDVVQIAKRVHDQEGYNLGSGSSREYRNEYWAKVIGIVHYGHPTYNPTPDPRWFLKNGGAGRPQSDDVAVVLPERKAWDFIGGVGANGYSFRVGEEFVLPPEQEIIQPPKPAGGSVEPPPKEPTSPIDLTPLVIKIAEVGAKVEALAQIIAGLVPKLDAAQFESFNAASRASEIKTLVDALPKNVAKPKYGGTLSLPKFLGGDRRIELNPEG